MFVVAQRSGARARLGTCDIACTINPVSKAPTVQHQGGLMDAPCRIKWWSLLGAVNEIRDTQRPDELTVHTV